ncbi:N-acetylneuraminate synthase family protein [Pseudomonas oryzihabitans]|uniref:N,N'-diacetyllegionaminate synthase n=1 Tax=Pseudomonas oryzihabitans TaxID=47885 RepID=A0AAJ2BTC2_9PSED|nr:N-acetylneuraminate synthase family protein [Pseudomonas psychrotolerans]MDR6236064.1 N,N'-diacetyllegionaminate synthase [Pseudomonas psychrotolerans]
MHQRPFAIAGREIGPAHPPYCIAEVGINHNGDLDTALRLIEVAKSAGADAVKFQTFKAEDFCGDPEQTFTYRSQGRTITEPMLEMFQRYQFTPAQWQAIKAHCLQVGITFFSTPQNRPDLDLLLQLGVPAIKVGSDDFTNLPLLESYAGEGLPLILSCGMSDLAEVHQALETVGWFAGRPLVLLLCTSQYPTPPGDVHLSRLTTLQQAFPGLTVGFSDHTQGPLAAALAFALGARVFEKHFTLDHDLPGPDHWFSEDPQGLALWVEHIHRAASMMGRPYVRPTAEELQNKREFQRVLIASCDIRRGESFSAANLGARRVAGGLGLPPSFQGRLLGRPASRDFQAGTVIEL